MRFSLFLALRYLKPRGTFVSIITLISITGVAFGVAALMVVIAVMSGFERRIKEVILGYEPHITLETEIVDLVDESGFPVGNEWRQVIAAVREVPGVEAASPFVQGLVFLEFGDEPAAALMRAIDPETDAQLTNPEALDMTGDFDLEGDKAVIGRLLAAELGILVGDTITVYSPDSVKNLVQAIRKVDENPDDDAAREQLEEIRRLVLPFDLEVTGITESRDFGQIVWVPLHIGQELNELGDSIPGVAVRTADAYRAREFEDAILRRLPPTWRSLTWTEKNRNFFDTIRMERMMMYFVLFIIMIVAAFCIMVTMITVTVQKRQEIGLVGALGSRVSQIVWVFLAQGMIVGVVGTATGLGLGGLILLRREDIRGGIARFTGQEIFDPAVYGVTEIPARVLGSDLAVICSGAFLLCAVAALVPAIFAAVIDPAKALRNV